jgi:hypothetical protein
MFAVFFLQYYTLTSAFVSPMVAKDHTTPSGQYYMLSDLFNPTPSIL